MKPKSTFGAVLESIKLNILLLDSIKTETWDGKLVEGFALIISLI
jgi:hypothetical protein